MQNIEFIRVGITYAQLFWKLLHAFGESEHEMRVCLAATLAFIAVFL